MPSETLTFLFVLLSTPALARTAAPAGGPWPDCGEVLVGFTPAQTPYLNRIQIALPKATGPSIPSSADGAVKAPQGTRWFVLDAGDTTKKGPWSTVLRVYGNPADAPLLEATFTQHHSYGVKVTWLNDKLLFINVPWGRLLATQLVLDVVSRKMVYVEEVH